jgi:hypothetical protein
MHASSRLPKACNKPRLKISSPLISNAIGWQHHYIQSQSYGVSMSSIWTNSLLSLSSLHLSRSFSFWVTNPDRNFMLVFGPDEAVSVARGASYSYFSIRLDERRVYRMREGLIMDEGYWVKFSGSFLSRLALVLELASYRLCIDFTVGAQRSSITALYRADR